MIAQLGDTLVCIAHYTASQAGKTGLADVVCTVKEVTLANPPVVTTPATAQAATELASGAYLYALAAASNDAKALYVFIFHTDDATVDQKDIVQGWATGMDWTENLVLTTVDVDGQTFIEAQRIQLGASGGKLSGAGTGTIVIRAADDSKTRVTATVDEFGNRSAITLDGTP